MQNPFIADEQEHSARTITGAVTCLQPSLCPFVTPPELAKDAADLLLARWPAAPHTGVRRRARREFIITTATTRRRSRPPVRAPRPPRPVPGRATLTVDVVVPGSGG